MRAAVCDDDAKLCLKLQMFLEEYGEMRGFSMEVDCFHDGKSLLNSLESGKKYDLIFLDIIMQHMDGVRVGEVIRNNMDDFYTRIIYMSGSKGRIEELFDSQPFNFWRKPLTKERALSVMDQFMKSIAGIHFCYRSRRIFNQIPYREILYYESSGRKVLIHTEREIYQYFGKLSQILDDKLPPNFLWIHKSYIVNMNHVGEIHSDCLYLPKEKKWLSISKPHRKLVEEAMDRTNFDRKPDQL